MSLTLGRSRRNAVVLTDDERSRHVQAVGASGTGKSKLLEGMIRQDILRGRGLCLIDPHGALVDDIVAWCASRNLHTHRRIHVIRAADSAWSVGFNPLSLEDGGEPSVRIDAVVHACAQVWGGTDMNATPRLKRTLRAVFYALATRGLTLTEAPSLTTASLSRVRHELTGDLPDYVFHQLWEDFNGLSRREFVEVFESANNRLTEFLASPVIRRILGQRQHTLDLRSVMDRGDIVLISLLPSGGLSHDNTRLLGTLLTSEFFLRAVERDVAYAARHPFTLYVDECYDYLTSDIERMLDQTRKFGLHLVLSHQRLSQLRQRSEAVYSGVMTGAQTKIVFGGLADEDAEVMAREVFRSSIRLERPKHVLDKLVVVDEVPYWLESESETAGAGQTYSTSEATSWSTTTASSLNVTDRLSVNDEALGYQVAEGESEAQTRGGTSGYTEANTRSRSTTRGRAQTWKPVRQWMPTALYSLEEELHLAIVKLRELPKQAAIIKRRGSLPVRFVPESVVSPLVRPERIGAFVEESRTRSAYMMPAAVVDAELAGRGADKARDGTEPIIEEFWSE